MSQKFFTSFQQAFSYDAVRTLYVLASNVIMAAVVAYGNGIGSIHAAASLCSATAVLSNGDVSGPTKTSRRSVTTAASDFGLVDPNAGLETITLYSWGSVEVGTRDRDKFAMRLDRHLFLEQDAASPRGGGVILDARLSVPAD
jgi:hypothetical protein